MQQNKSKKQKYKKKTEVYCQDCQFCEEIEEGTFVCNKNKNKIRRVINNYMPTKNYMYCNEWNK